MLPHKNKQFFQVSRLEAPSRADNTSIELQLAMWLQVAAMTQRAIIRCAWSRCLISFMEWCLHHGPIGSLFTKAVWAGVFGFLSLGNGFLHCVCDTDGHVSFATIRAFMKYTDTDASKYVKTPGSHRGAEGDRDGCAFLLPSSLRLLTEDNGTRLCGRFTVHKEGGRER